MTSEARIPETLMAARRRLRLPGLHAWGWLAPVVAAVCIRYRPNSPSKLIAGLVAVALVIVIARRPAGALLFLVPWMAFQHVVLATMFRFGFPFSLVRSLGGVKEAVLAGLIVAAVRNKAVNRRRFDALDKLALVYVLAVTAYLLFPTLLVDSKGLPGTHQTLQVRSLSYRVDVFFVLLFLAVRHAPIDRSMTKRFVQVVMGTGVAVAAVAVYEFFFSSQWNDFSVHSIQVLQYKILVLKVFEPDPTDVRFHGLVGSRQVVRPGSVLYQPVPLAFYLLIALGLAIALVGTRRFRPSATAGTAVIAAGLIFTLTRSAVAAGLIIAVVLVRPTIRQSAHPGRARLALLLAVGLILAVPVAAGSGLASRATGKDDRSAAGHVQTMTEGLTALTRQPLGFGLGAEPGIGDRFAIPTKLTSHDSYLQVGNELGIPTMIVFTALLISLLVALHRAETADDPSFPLARAMFAVGLALAIGGVFQHVWTEFPVAWTFWAGAGLALGVADRRWESPAEAPNNAPPVSPNILPLAAR